MTNELNTNSKISDKEILAQNIAFFRKKLNLSQSELGAKIQYSNKNISKWEKGETTPDIFTLKKLSCIFGVPVDTLLNPISEDSKKAIETKSVVPLRFKVYMLLLVVSIIILCGCVAFYVLKSLGVHEFQIYYIFIYILPLIDLSVFIFLCCIRKKVDIISLSLFGWLVTICLHISLLKYENIAYIYIVAAGYQLLVIFITFLINTKKTISLNKLFFKNKKTE